MRSQFFRLAATSLCILLLAPQCLPDVSAHVPYRTDVENTREDVLDLLFPRNVNTRQYYARFVLRFSNPDGQLDVYLYPGGAAEVVRFSLHGPRGQSVSEVASEMLRRNPGVTPRDIARMFGVTTNREPINREKLKKALTALKKLRLPAYPRTVVVVDARSIYDYWFDSGGESIHYSMFGPVSNTQYDSLLQWMISFRRLLQSN